MTIKVWNEDLVSSDDKELDIQGVKFNVVIFKTDRQDKGIAIPLEQNNTDLCNRFWDYCKELWETDTSIKDRDKKYKLLRFQTFLRAETDNMEPFKEFGFYVFDSTLIFADEPDGIDPFKRMDRWTVFFMKKFDIYVDPRRTMVQLLKEIDLADEDDEGVIEL